MSINFDRAQQLLNVIKEAVAHPNLQWLRDAALAELHKLKPEVPAAPPSPPIAPVAKYPPDRPKEVNDIIERKV